VTPDVRLAGWILGFILAGTAGGFWFWGAPILRQIAFPICFLAFMLPLPETTVESIETFLQHASADLSAVLFSLFGTPFVRNETGFWLPGLRIEVARECSGIRSTLMLFITATLAAHLMLKTPWKQATLALAVIPLGILRNAIRILTISLLSVHVDPEIINSPLHHRGGPLFFLASLPLLFALLWLLRRSERPVAA
jgi:exosortase